VTDYVQKANQYIDDVLSCRIIACKWTRAACQRQRDDLARQDWSYYFDADAANVVCAFLECLTHVKGEHGGEKLKLELWQCFYITTVFGWKQKVNNRRRFRRSLLFCGKGQGKSFLSSGLCLYMLAVDGEPGAEVVCAARATDQARLVFDTARDIARANQKLCESFGIAVLQHSIVQKASASTMKPVSAQGKSLAGKIPHFASCDETWSHRDREVVDEMERGTDKRVNSLLSTISHAGPNLLSVGFEQFNTARKILSGEYTDERTFCVLYTAEGFDWKSDDALWAANPNLGVSVYLDTLREGQQRAVLIPALQATFKSHNLCLWEDGTEIKQWVSKEILAPCREAGITMESYRLWLVGEHSGVIQPDMLRPFVVGVERSSLQERAAVVYCCKGFLDGVEHFYLFGKYYDSEANSDEQLADAVLAGYRNHIGYGVTEHADDGFSLKALAHDSWVTPSPRIEKCGIAMLPFAKTARTFSPVLDWTMSLALAGRLHFDDEILASHLLGIHAKRDLNNNLFPRRANPDKPIDAAIAALYALRLAMAPNFLAPPEVSDCPVTFIMEDDSVMQSGPNGLVQVLAPIAEKPKGAHPSDLL